MGKIEKVIWEIVWFPGNRLGKCIQLLKLHTVSNNKGIINLTCKTCNFGEFLILGLLPI